MFTLKRDFLIFRASEVSELRNVSGNVLDWLIITPGTRTGSTNPRSPHTHIYSTCILACPASTFSLHSLSVTLQCFIINIYTSSLFSQNFSSLHAHTCAHTLTRTSIINTFPSAQSKNSLINIALFTPHWSTGSRVKDGPKTSDAQAGKGAHTWHTQTHTLILDSVEVREIKMRARGRCTMLHLRY